MKIFIGLTIIFGLSLLKSIIENNVFQSTWLKSVSTITFLILACLAVILVNKHLNKIEFRDSKLSFKNIHLNIIKGTAIFIPVILFPVLIILLVNHRLNLNYQGINILISVGVSALLVSIFEEFVFRGFVSQTLFSTTANLMTTSLISSIFFLLLHLNTLIKDGNIKYSISLFFAGILLTYLFFYYSSIWVPVGFHFANNLFNALIDSDLNSTSQLNDQLYNELLVWIYTAGIIIATLVLMVKYHKLDIRKLLPRRAI